MKKRDGAETARKPKNQNGTNNRSDDIVDNHMKSHRASEPRKNNTTKREEF